jgi:hypothetical protein
MAAPAGSSRLMRDCHGCEGAGGVNLKKAFYPNRSPADIGASGTARLTMVNPSPEGLYFFRAGRC